MGFYWRKDDKRWNGRLDLSPSIKEDGNYSDILYTQWATWDDSDVDYNDKDLFYVFSNIEVMQLINCLNWALTGCKAQFDMNHWYCGDNFIPVHDNELDDWRC